MLGDDERADARESRRSAARGRRGRAPVSLGPAVDRDVADRARRARPRPGPGCSVASSSTSSGCSTAALPTTTRCTPAANRSLASSTERTPPPLCTRTSTFAQIASITREVRVAAVARRVEVDDVDPARACCVEAPRDRDRDRRRRRVSRVVVAAEQPHDPPAEQVDRRIEIHQRHGRGRVTKLREQRQADVAALLGVELRGPQRSALDRGREPPAVVAPRGDDRVVGGLRRERVHEVAPRGIGQAREQPRARPCARACSNPSAAAARCPAAA